MIIEITRDMTEMCRDRALSTVHGFMVSMPWLSMTFGKV